MATNGARSANLGARDGNEYQAEHREHQPPTQQDVSRHSQSPKVASEYTALPLGRLLSAFGLGKELHVREAVEVLVLCPHHRVDRAASSVDDTVCQRELVVDAGLGCG